MKLLLTTNGLSNQSIAKPLFDLAVLILGVPDSEGKVILITPDKADPVIGGKLF
jgi:hypothetical protein